MGVDDSVVRGHAAAAAKMGEVRIDRLSAAVRAALGSEPPGEIRK
jgi:hypothetical protein